MFLCRPLLEVAYDADLEFHRADVGHRCLGIEVCVLDFEGDLARLYVILEALLIGDSCIVGEIESVGQDVVAAVIVEVVGHNHTVHNDLIVDVDVLPNGVGVIGGVGTIIVGSDGVLPLVGFHRVIRGYYSCFL